MNGVGSSRLEKEMEWLKKHTNFIENLITVGGESRKIKYPGPSVNMALKAIKDNSKLNILCGGILSPAEKESLNLIEKSTNGSEFFTTQVLYDSSKIIKMISHYKKDVMRILFQGDCYCFAPVSSKRILISLKWLG